MAFTLKPCKIILPADYCAVGESQIFVHWERGSLQNLSSTHAVSNDLLQIGSTSIPLMNGLHQGVDVLPYRRAGHIPVRIRDSDAEHRCLLIPFSPQQDAMFLRVDIPGIVAKHARTVVDQRFQHYIDLGSVDIIVLTNADIFHDALPEMAVSLADVSCRTRYSYRYRQLLRLSVTASTAPLVVYRHGATSHDYDENRFA